MPGSLADFGPAVIASMKQDIATRYSVPAAQVIVQVFAGSVVVSVTLPQAASISLQQDAKASDFRLGNKPIIAVHTNSGQAATFAKQATAAGDIVNTNPLQPSPAATSGAPRAHGLPWQATIVAFFVLAPTLCAFARH